MSQEHINLEEQSDDSLLRKDKRSYSTEKIILTLFLAFIVLMILPPMPNLVTSMFVGLLFSMIFYSIIHVIFNLRNYGRGIKTSISGSIQERKVDIVRRKGPHIGVVILLSVLVSGITFIISILQNTPQLFLAILFISPILIHFILNLFKQRSDVIRWYRIHIINWFINWKNFFKIVFSSRRNLTDFLFKVLLGIFTLIIISPFFLILYQVGSVGFAEIFGGSNLNEALNSFATFFLTEPGAGLTGGVNNAFVGTLLLISFASAVGIPLSVFGAVYINEYTQPGKVRNLIEFTSDVLAGIPSIVFGAFGFAFLVGWVGLGMGLLSGSLTLAFMMIPTVLRTTQEALRAVPMSLREASLALGATKWSTTWNVTLRAAFPGVVTGVLLAIGRVMGETAPLIFTSGNSLTSPEIRWIDDLVGPESWVASMPYTIWAYISEPAEYLNIKAHATAVALMIMVLAIDIVANIISRKVTRRLV
jgi:phosphate transport system permease protein